MSAADLQARFRGCLLGLAVGDALGARFEGQSADSIRRRFPTPQSFVGHWSSNEVDTHGMAPGVGEAVGALEGPAFKRLVYTDDTQMAIGVAEALLEADRPRVEDYATAFVRNFQPWRGYGRGARFALSRIEDGLQPAEAALSYFADGSYGNGAAMRVAPVGLRFHGDTGAIVEQARVSSGPTHAHPLGIEGAVLLATAVGLALGADAFDRDRFSGGIQAVSTLGPFKEKVDRARGIQAQDIGELGNGIEALESVPTALACFACWPSSFVDAVGGAVLLGGDTDTIAAMTGALSGAYLGVEAIPSEWLTALEDDAEAKGRSYIRDLADKLLEKAKA